MGIIAKGILPVCLYVTVGCGGSMPTTVGTGPWLPLKLGNHWTYLITEADGTSGTKVQGVSSEGVVGGEGPYKDKMAFLVLTGGNNSFGDESFQAVEGTRVVRYRDRSIDGSTGDLKNEQFWDPPKLRMDETPTRTSLGESWVETYDEHLLDTPVLVDGGLPPDAGTLTDGGLADMTKRVEDLWSVEKVDDPVTVPAGKFSALKLKRTQRIPKITVKYFWFVRGVGKVKESGDPTFSLEQTEELVRYVVTP